MDTEIFFFDDQRHTGMFDQKINYIFVENYIRPIKIVIVGAVHIAQYLINFAKSLNFEITIIYPRGYFASEQRFPSIKIINKCIMIRC